MDRFVQTSALDTYTEQALLQNINSILKEKQRTSVFVAHRLRTIYDSDQILVLKDGMVAERGNHSELLEQSGVYAELWNGKLARSVLVLGILLTVLCVAQEQSLAQDADPERDIKKETLEAEPGIETKEEPPTSSP
jgi:ABC transporter ATM